LRFNAYFHTAHTIPGHGHSHGIGECSHGHSHGAEKPRNHGEDASHGHEHGDGGCSAHGDSHGDSHAHGHGHGQDVEMGAEGGGGGDDHGAHKAPKMNMNEWSMYLHVMGDALGSAFVVVNACIIKYGGAWGDNRLLADPLTSLVMVFIIMIQTVPLVRDTCLILMETVSSSAFVCFVCVCVSLACARTKVVLVLSLLRPRCVPRAHTLTLACFESPRSSDNNLFDLRVIHTSRTHACNIG